MAVWVEIKCYSVVYFDCVTVFHSKTALYLRTRISGLALITRHPLGVRVTCSKFKVHCAAPYWDVYNVVQKKRVVYTNTLDYAQGVITESDTTLGQWRTVCQKSLDK